MPELHNTYARLQNGVIVRIGPPASWHAAVQRWDRLDSAMRQRARRAIPHFPGLGPVAYYAVRSVDDPTWQTDTVMSSRAIRYRRTRAQDRPHTVEVFTDRRFRATPPHCAMLRTSGNLVIGYGLTETHAIADARQRARIAGVV